ncbi:MAG: chemotaxis response regulator protein-glutamate methylesterase [Venatoribacter sp.]
MSIRVLVVDDSGFFRRRVTEIINSDSRMEVVGVASNGQEAIEKNGSLQPDVITMDYEMPVMDGITAIRHIMRSRPVPVLMFSSLTFEGARVTLDALDAGAVDFLPKNFEDIAKDTQEIKRALTDKIAAVAKSRRISSAPTHTAAPTTTARSSVVSRPAPAASQTVAHSAGVAKVRMGHKELVVIGTSTGGPAALQTLFRTIPGSFRVPIIIVQHMPGSFTKAFAERLNNLSPLTVKEAENGDRLMPGHVYVAPGGMQLMVDRRNGGTIMIHESDERINYRPSVDITFASVAKHYGNKVLGVVLTGMGADGREGARLIKQVGGHIWAQDEASCVIYGMPMAIVKANLADEILPLDQIGTQLTNEIS